MQPDITFILFGNTLEVKSYTLFTLLGALIGIITALPLFRREGLKLKQSIILIVLMAAAFLVGARLFNFIVNPNAYGKSLHIYSLCLAGFSVYGGILSTTIAVILWSKMAKINIWFLLDALVLPFGLSFALARIGCFLNGCCAGIPTNSIFGVPFPINNNGQKIMKGVLSILGNGTSTVCRYPTQLFEMVLALLGLIPVLWLYFGKKLPRGASFLIYGIWFSMMRLMILPLRNLPYPDIIVKLYYPLLYISLIILGLFFLRILYIKNNKN